MVLRVVFLKIGEIDTIHEKYTADVFYQGKWLEPKLDGKTEIVSISFLILYVVHDLPFSAK